MWQAIKEHFEAARDEYAHSLYNSIMKVRISTLEKAEAEDAGHLFYDGAKGKGDAVINPFRSRQGCACQRHSSSAQPMPIEFTAWWCTPSPSSST